MTLADLMKADVDDVFLNLDDFAVSVIRLRDGSQSSRQPVTGIFTQMPVDVTTARGKGYDRRAELMLNDSYAICEADAFMVEKERWEVERIGKPQDGAVTVYLRRYEGEIKGARAAGDL